MGLEEFAFLRAPGEAEDQELTLEQKNPMEFS